MGITHVTLRLAAIATAISIGVVLGAGGMLLLGVMACSSVLVQMMGLRRLLFHQDNGVLTQRLEGHVSGFIAGQCVGDGPRLSSE